MGKKKRYLKSCDHDSPSTVIELCLPTKLVRVINTCLNETYGEVRLGTLLCFVPHLTLCIDSICAEDHQGFSNLILTWGVQWHSG